MKNDLRNSASKVRPFQTKDDGGNNEVIDEVKKSIDEVMSAFEEFKKTNDVRLEEVEKKGAADPLHEEKLDRIEETLGKAEEANKKLVLANQEQKDQVQELKNTIDELETAMKRTAASAGDSVEAKEAFANNWARGVMLAIAVGDSALTEDMMKAVTETRDEWKSLAVQTDTLGGYLAPMEYVRDIIKGITEMSPVRSLARVRTTSQKALQIPKRTGQFAAQWVAEQGNRSETTGLTYGLEEIPTHEFYALIDMSNQMLEDSAFNMSSEISMESSEQFAVAEGTAFVTGNGVGRPQGFLDTDSGIGTTNSGNATKITADGIFDLKYAVKSGYMANGTFLLNRTSMGAVRKLKDGNGQYLWQPGIAAGRANTIDGDPYVEVPDMPNEGAGLKPMAYGDWRRAYTWIDRIAMEMLRDPYTQATSGNIRFIMRKRVGGQVTLAEAARILVCAA